MMRLNKMETIRYSFQFPTYAMNISRLNYCTFHIPMDQKIISGAEDLLKEKNKILEIKKHSTEVQVLRAVEASFKKYAWHTLEIEGIQATTSEISKVREAFNFIQSSFRFGRLDEHVIFQTNGIFTNENYVKYRSENVFIRNPNGKIARSPDYEEVPTRMKNLILFMNSTGVKMKPVIIGSLFKAYFVQIHPFMDGNGRTSRAFLNDILVKNDFPFVCIPAEEIEEYYHVINNFAERDEVVPYFKYIYFCIERSLQSFRRDLQN